MTTGLKFLKTCRFEVHGTPVPWSVPDIGTGRSKIGKRFRFAKKNPALESWQELVHKEARKAYGPYEPHTGLIYLGLEFLLHTDDPNLWDRIISPDITWVEDQARHKKQGGLADRTNLIKGVEDALEGVFFVNDQQVRIGSDACFWSDHPSCVVVVGFLDPTSICFGRL